MANDRSGQGNDAASPVRPVRFAGSETSEASTTNIGLSVESFVNLLRSANHGLLNLCKRFGLIRSHSP